MRMIDFTKIVGFDWDAGNERKSVDKHRVSQSEAEQVFVNSPVVITLDIKHSQDETRLQALGKTNEGRLLHVSFTMREGGTRIQIISARDMHRKERSDYEEASS